MLKHALSTVAAAGVATMIALSAQAMPASPAPAQQAQPDVTYVAGGCGPGYHRNPYNYCVPNGYYARPYYPPRACPYGYRMDPWGRCVPW